MPKTKTMRKITFNLPEELIRRLKKLPTSKRSMLVKLAVEKELGREAAAANLKRIRRKTIWNKKNHPDLLSPEDFAHYRPMKTHF